MPKLTAANDAGPSANLVGEKRRRLRRWLHKITWVVAILAPLTFLVAAIGYKLGLFSLGLSLRTLTFKVGPLLLAVSLVLGVLSLLSAWIVKPKQGFIAAAVAMLIPILGIAKIGQTKSVSETLPYIHDITTDTQEPPVFGDIIMTERAAVKGVNTADYIGKRAPSKTADGKNVEELVSVLQTKSYPQIRPLVMGEAKEVVFGKALATAKSMGWKIKDEDLAAGRIDATETTFWYGFEDDITIRLRKSEGGGIIVDVRSLSRVGGSDLGKNAERVGAFLEKLGG